MKKINALFKQKLFSGKMTSPYKFVDFEATSPEFETLLPKSVLQYPRELFQSTELWPVYDGLTFSLCDTRAVNAFIRSLILVLGVLSFKYKWAYLLLFGIVMYMVFLDGMHMTASVPTSRAEKQTQHMDSFRQLMQPAVNEYCPAPSWWMNTSAASVLPNSCS